MPTRTRPLKGVKTWRLSYYKAHPSRKPGHVFLSFLTVGEALEHVRLMGITKFYLEDHLDPALRAN